MKRRTFLLASALGAVGSGTAHAQRISSRTRQLRAAAEREERRLERTQNALAKSLEFIELASMWMAVHDAQVADGIAYGREYGGPTLAAALAVGNAMSAIEFMCFLGPGTAGLDEASRARDRAFEIRRAVLDGAARHAAADPRGLEFWRGTVLAQLAEAIVMASALLHDPQGVRDSVDDLRRIDPSNGVFRFPKYWQAVGCCLLNQNAEAYRLVRDELSASRAQRPISLLTTAAYAGANVGSWRDAWGYLMRAYGFSAGNDTERLLWSHFDGAAVLLSTRQGSQLWFADRTTGWRGSTKFDLPALNRIDVKRFALALGAEDETPPPDQLGWAGVIAATADSNPAVHTPGREELRRRVAQLSAYSPPGFARAFEVMIDVARTRGVRRLAWLPEPALTSFPVHALSATGVPGQSLQISSITSMRSVASVSDRIQSIEPLRIRGGDEDIPLAEVERGFVSAISPSPTRQDNWVLHVSSHSAVRANGRLEIKTGARRWISIEELMTQSGWSRPPRLVVLSSCSSFVDLTGLAAAAFDFEITGQARALTDAGVPGVIGTLWETSDASAFLFGTRFYGALLEENLSPREAYQAAVDWLRLTPLDACVAYVEQLGESGRVSNSDVELILGQIVDRGEPIPFAHPFYWATWAYWGV